MKRKALKITAAVLAVLVLLSAAAVGLYAADYYHADDTALAALAPSAVVTVETEDGITVFQPEGADTGLIFYPGGKVEYTAYAPLLAQLAQQGILCVLVEMPLNLAVLDMDAAQGIPEQFPDIETWYIGGHSLGGSMAASYAAEGDGFAGLLLLAAYSTADLTGTDLAVLSIYGSEDGVLNMEKYQEYFPNLPDDTTEVVLDGGNHAQFGSYGCQDGDGTAVISPQEQVQSTVTEVLAWIQS